jgi:hypothetical protein
VIQLLRKIKQNGVSLEKFIPEKPSYGVKTGLNDAFLVDTATRDQLVRDDPKCADIIKPYLRGQDIERWSAPWSGLWMIFTRRGIDISKYPSIKRHLSKFRARLEPKPAEWKPKAGEKWLGRKEGNYEWYEIQDSVDYWPQLEGPKIVYGDIAWSASFAIDHSGLYLNNTGYFIGSDHDWIVACLNSPLGWWYSWRKAQHGKDEALRYFNTFIEQYPIAPMPPTDVSTHILELSKLTQELRRANASIIDWLRVEFGVVEPNRLLELPHRLNEDSFIEAARACLPRGRKLSAADLVRLRQEWMTTVSPSQARSNQILTIERRLSDLINAAYGLSTDDVKLMWQTAPPRMPLDPAEELRRLDFLPVE